MTESPLPPILRALQRRGPATERFAELDGVPKRARALWKPILPLERPRETQRAVEGQPTGEAEAPPAPLPGERFPLLFANVLPVLGERRALLCDLQRRRAHAILPALVELLVEAQGEPLSALRDRFEGRLDAKLDALLQELIDLELLWLSPTPDPPPLTLRFAHPARVTNAVLDWTADSTYDPRARFAELEALGCEHALLRVRGGGLLAPLLERLRGQAPLALQVWVEGEPPEALRVTLERWPRVVEIVAFQRPPQRDGRLVCVPQALSFALPDAPVAQDMAVCVEQAAESLAHDCFAHRKVFITAEGLPSDGRRGFRDQPLIELIEDPIYTERWHVTRAQVAGCADCALRRVCVDPGELVPEGGGGWRRATRCPLRC